ncbi:MAG TPA: alanine--tRNA ligase [Bacteroidales bacterium]|mgnify:CR=1 FL=1|nr:alanine--tRNA ligase [Bacteroidales bacterium]
MKSRDIRQAFFDFFASKGHQIVPSAPMVIKDDPTLMFTNAGMNQFKEIFLGHTPARYLRIANTQKCLRVSGKHNDLEEVGHDTYHHTMFEMLGNWSFGDYFKKEAIAWAWELLTEVYGIPTEKLYVTVFEGDKSEDLEADEESRGYWKAFLADDRILYGNKKDNFWEMGDTGPCGPCSEIHVDLRPAEDRALVSGRELVNTGHPLVIEIWNLVFIQYNRKADGSLQPLPSRHVDTGMGFERLCMALQGTTSNYDTDVFQPIIHTIAQLSRKPYGAASETDVAMRVIADHLRAVAFAIADGQLPSNVRAGYVIRRILRRAVRYAFTFLGQEEPFMYKLVPVFVQEFGDVFPEIRAQQELLGRVIHEEEHSFLRTLSQGILRFQHYLEQHTGGTIVSGDFAFELFDTFGFPVDLTQLLAREKGMTVDMDGFEQGLRQQKERSRAAAAVDTGDWIILQDETESSRFIGWDSLETQAVITRYRKVIAKDKIRYQYVLDQTPFYAEAGGQIGDRGWFIQNGTSYPVQDTRRENNLILHITGEALPDPSARLTARVNGDDRARTAANHSATHLMHKALREVLGQHVEQKGSLVEPGRLRFDFSHFGKMTDEEIRKVEEMVNDMIQANLSQDEMREIPLDDAREMGAMALFGEKYGETVRVIRFGDSVELCGGTHVRSTGQIGLFKITSEGAIAAGIRRIEALTGQGALAFINERLDQWTEIRSLFKNTKDPVRSVQDILEQHRNLEQELEALQQEKIRNMAQQLLGQASKEHGITRIITRMDMPAKQIRDLSFELERLAAPLLFVAGTVIDSKASLTVSLSKSLCEQKKLNASQLVKEWAQPIQGSGGGQPHYATAGGPGIDGLDKALEMAKQYQLGEG